MSITVNKKDRLFKYLVSLGADEPLADKYYHFFAKNGYTTVKDVQYFISYENNGGFEIEYDEEILKNILPYYNEIKKLKTPSKKAIKLLLEDYQAHKCDGCLQNIVIAHLKTVLNIAYCYKLKYKQADINDLLQWGNYGLIKAITKYNADTKIEFMDYLNFWVRHYIIQDFFTDDKGEINE